MSIESLTVKYANWRVETKGKSSLPTRELTQEAAYGSCGGCGACSSDGGGEGCSGSDGCGTCSGCSFP